MDEQTPKKKKKRRRRRRRNSRRWIWVIVWLIVLAAIIGYCLYEQIDRRSTPDVQPNASATGTPAAQLEIDPNAGALITPTPAPQEPGVAIPGWGSMTIPAGVTEVATSMQNPEANEGWYYLTFELRLKDTDEVIFTTGLIPPGQYCNQVTLTRALEKGEYAAIVHVQPYRISDQSPTNNADMETVLIVE